MAEPTTRRSLGTVLVVGGCGFVGHHIVKQLLSTGQSSSVAVLDLRTTRNRLPESAGVRYFDGDISSAESIAPVFDEVRPDVVMHTASPMVAPENVPLYEKVNVQGTKNLVEAAAKVGCKAFVYTSSASVVSDNVSDLVNADERWPIVPPHLQTEPYSTTKAKAETFVLTSTRKLNNMQTCAIRPAGIMGEGDQQQLPAMMAACRAGLTRVQLGPNTNLFDFTYVGNVAHAHLLAAAALLASHARGSEAAPLDHERVDGEAFFVSNETPVYFWDYTRRVWKELGDTTGTNVWVIPRESALVIAFVLEWLFWVFGKKPRLTRQQVRYSCMTRYYSCDKARKRLGYRPLVGLEEGIRRAVAHALEEERREGEKKGL